MPREALTMGVATDPRGARDRDPGDRRAQGDHRAPCGRGRDRLEVAATFLQRHPEHHVLRRPSPPRADLTRDGDAVAARRGRVDAGPDGARGRLAVATDRQGDPQAHPARLHRASDVVARGALRHAGRASTATCSTRSAPRSAARPSCRADQRGHLLLAAPRRRRDLDGRHPASWSRTGNEITIAYMTSGNIAVFDHDVRRFSRLPAAGSRADGKSTEDAAASCAKGWTTFLAKKRPGEVDIAEVQDIKRMIREAEAVSGRSRRWASPSSARFLDLPFYQTGKVAKDPIGPADVAIVRDAARGGRAGAGLRRRRPAPIRTAPTGCARRRSTARCSRSNRRTPARGLALSRGLAGVADHRGHLARAAVAGGAPAQDPGDLQAPVPEGLGALPRTGRARVLAAGGGSATRTRPPCSTGSAWPSISRWRRTRPVD